MPLVIALGFVLALFAPASAQTATDPASVVKAIYGASDPIKAKVYSKRLQALLDKDSKAAKGEAGNLDFDFAANGQDTGRATRRRSNMRRVPKPPTAPPSP